MNTGIKQAVTAYKVAPNGAPVDINGQLTSISGRKQAIALLIGRPNPNPTLYEIEYYFNVGGLVEGEPTTKIDINYCPISKFTIDTTSVVLHPGNASQIVNIFASFGWQFVGPFAFATSTPAVGEGGSTAVTIARTSTLGQGNMVFRDNTTGETKSIYVINTDALGWILETGFWNNLRFWSAAGVWNN